MYPRRGGQPHLDFLFRALCDSPPSLKTSKHVRFTTTAAATATATTEVGFSFGLSLKTYKCNPIMMFAPSMTPPFARALSQCFPSLPSRPLPPSPRLLTDREIYSRPRQLSLGNSISSKNDPPSRPPLASLVPLALSLSLAPVELRRAIANGKSASNRPEISSGEKSPDF